MQNFCPDQFFRAEWQKHLSELMNLWRAASDRSEPLPTDQQIELDAIVEVELKAAITRTSTLMEASLKISFLGDR